MSWYDEFLTVAYPLRPEKPIPTTVFLGVDLYVPTLYGEPRIRSLYNTSNIFSCVISDGTDDLAVLTVADPKEGIYDVLPIAIGVYGSVVLGPGVGRDIVVSDEELFFEENVITRYERTAQDADIDGTQYAGTLKVVLPAEINYEVTTELHDLGNGVAETSVVRFDVADESLLVRAVPPGLRDGNATPATQCIHQINSVPPRSDGVLNLTFLQRRRREDQPDVSISTTTQGVITISDAGDVCT